LREDVKEGESVLDDNIEMCRVSRVLEGRQRKGNIYHKWAELGRVMMRLLELGSGEY
jgi:hypothetical protein